MKLFLDSGDRVEINQKWKGVFAGVTCNPTILKKDGITDPIAYAHQVAQDIYPLPLSVECPKLRLEDCKRFIDAVLAVYENDCIQHTNVVIKIPILDHNGRCLIELMQLLLNHYNGSLSEGSSPILKLNVTCLMSAQQAFLVSQLGNAIQYVSLFAGRIDDMNGGAVHEIKRTAELLKATESSTKIIACSVRQVSNILQWLEAGADIVTVPPSYLEKMAFHPRTRETVEQFTRDAEV